MTGPAYVALGYRARNPSHCTNTRSAIREWYRIFPVRLIVFARAMDSTYATAIR